MGIVSAAVLFIVIWWVVIFAVLPFWVKPALNPDPAWDQGAPEHPHLKRKFIITTIIAFVLWVITCALILADIDVLNFIFTD